MSAFLFGPEGGVAAGYLTCPAGTPLLRGHSPGKSPAWFGPAIGADGTNRYDMPHRALAADPGTCYLAPALEGVIVERVIRDVWRPLVSLAKMKTQHALAHIELKRDLVLVDLIKTVWTVHRLQVHEVTAPPPYTRTIAIAAELFASSPSDIDGIAYSSRFGSSVECIALWDRASAALTWQGSEPLGIDEDAFALACENLGLGLLP